MIILLKPNLSDAMKVFFVAIIICIGLVESSAIFNDTLAVAICLTTVPPRFTSVHHTILSWLSQKPIAPQYIFVTVPANYLRFRKKKSINPPQDGYRSNQDLLAIALSKEVVVKEAFDKGIVRIVVIEKDFGPASKLAGLITFRKELWTDAEKRPKYWIICDDDVHYMSDAIIKYAYYMHWSKQELLSVKKDDGTIIQNAIGKFDPRTVVLTHFAEDVRLMYTIRNNGTLKTYGVKHLQGVDTFLIADELLTHHSNKALSMSPLIFPDLVEFVHRICKNSFFQDDYLLSMLFHFGGAEVHSLWLTFNENVAKHVEGVSKSNFQMHMNAAVHTREYETKQCLENQAQIIWNYYVERRNSTLNAIHYTADEL